MVSETASRASSIIDEIELRDRNLALRPASQADNVFLAFLDMQERREAYARLTLPEALLERISAAHLNAQTEAFMAEYKGAERLLICRRGEPVGRVWLAMHGRGATRSLHLIDMVLREDVRGLGIGSDILCSLVDSARAMRLERVTVAIFAGNERGIGLCRRIGFRPQGVIDDAGNVSMAYPLG